MIALILASLVWIGVHIGVSGTLLRDRIVAKTGEGGFMAAYSIVSVVSIGLLIAAYDRSDTVLLWVMPTPILWLLALLMLPAVILFVGSIVTRGPTMPAKPGAPPIEPRGVIRITRHPMLWSFAIWAGVHMLANGDSASFVFFGTFLVTALAGMPSIDRKIARREPYRWEAIAEATSLLPFGAIRSGRNRLVMVELMAQAIPIGMVVWLALIFAHPYVIGVPAVAGF